MSIAHKVFICIFISLCFVLAGQAVFADELRGEFELRKLDDFYAMLGCQPTAIALLVYDRQEERLLSGREAEQKFEALQDVNTVGRSYCRSRTTELEEARLTDFLGIEVADEHARYMALRLELVDEDSSLMRNWDAETLEKFRAHQERRDQAFEALADMLRVRVEMSTSGSSRD